MAGINRFVLLEIGLREVKKFTSLHFKDDSNLFSCPGLIVFQLWSNDVLLSERMTSEAHEQELRQYVIQRKSW